ncbi:TonB-dependent receptor SusC [termite gut metagenome]|uniref:TonB-dependent receptor SusC n=1 Tax=termite gut metagenome TaxID=433724 RepID=A0A5J4QEB4_9ZZZZ
MKQIWIAFVLTIGTIQGIFAQQIEIKGAIKDATNKESVEFANVVLQTTDSVFIAGIAAGANGRFALEKVIPGNYLLTVSGLGYRTQYLQLDNLKESTTLGDIMLEEELIALDNVTVSASNLSSR